MAANITGTAIYTTITLWSVTVPVLAWMGTGIVSVIILLGGLVGG